jgi:hypothetical protein
MPAFEVEELPGKVERTVYYYEEKDTGRKDKNGNPVVTHHLRTKKTQEPAGYMVYFARGHSIRVRSDEELRRLNLDRSPHLSDPTGEIADEDIEQMGGAPSLKEHSKTLVRQNSRGKAASKSSDQLANPEGE